jgi:predicted LPLAT superfamily acyltransferase
VAAVTFASAPARWQHMAERGSVIGIRILVTLSTLLGRRITSLLLPFIAAWYGLADGEVRRASRAYLRRIHGRASLPQVIRHIRCFAQVTLDRLFLLRGRLDAFALVTHGEEHLLGLTERRQGAILVMAHLGSFEVMRAMSTARQLPINILGYFQNARLINAVLVGLDPSVDARFISVRPDDPTFVFEVEDRIRAGEMVGTMGDRVGFDGKSVRVPFLGGEAAFPTGPYLLAAVLRCPVFLAFGLYRAPDRYDLYCEPFADRVELPRGARQAELKALAARYAARLEAYCRQAPDNWFNFYDFWS